MNNQQLIKVLQKQQPKLQPHYTRKSGDFQKDLNNTNYTNRTHSTKKRIFMKQRTGTKELKEIKDVQINDQISVNGQSVTGQSLMRSPSCQSKTRLNRYTEECPQDYRSQDHLECFDVDPYLIDKIPISDPIWLQILPENVLNNVNLERLIEENRDYFNHNLGLCACFRCKCGRCRCDIGNKIKHSLLNQGQSIYAKDFIRKSTDLNRMQPLNEGSYGTPFLNQQIIDQTTTNRYSYRKNDVEYRQPLKQPYQEKVNKLSTLTSYNSSYNNWGKGDALIMKRPIHISTSNDIPFIGKTNYQQAFQFNSPKLMDKEYRKNLSPLPQGPFFGETSNQKSFPVFKIGQSNMKKQGNNYQKIPSYNGQFKSTTSNDFVRNEEGICPAQVYKRLWKQKVIDKYNEIRGQKKQQQC